MEHSQNLFSASTGALFCDKKTDPSPYTFRKKKVGSSVIIYGPACWGVSENIDYRMWLRKNGFNMSDVDKTEKLLQQGLLFKEDRAFIEDMNSQLKKKSMQLAISQKKWLQRELHKIAKIKGLSFVTSSHAISVLTLWHHLEYPIHANDDFHTRWLKSEYRGDQLKEEFLTKFLFWKIKHDSKFGKTKESCIHRYGIIVNKIIF